MEEFSRELPDLSGAAVRSGAVITASDAVHILRLALVSAEYAIKGREHTGFITKALEATKGPLAAPVAASEPTDLTPAQIFDIATPYFAWTKNGKEYGTWQIATQGVIGMPALLEYTKKVLSARAADAPFEPSEALENIFESWDGCKYDDIDIGAALRADFKTFVFGKSRAADALESQPTDDGKDDLICKLRNQVDNLYAELDALKTASSQPTEAPDASVAYAQNSIAAIRQAVDASTDKDLFRLVDEDIQLLESYISSQPTDGEVRNG